MIDREDIERLKEIFVTRQECDTITDDINKKLSNDSTELALIKQKLDTITWVSKTTLAAVIVAIVGAIMAEDMMHIDFKDMTEGIPAFLTILCMPLTYSIANGFGIGFISYVLLKTFTGRVREVHPVMWIVSVCFAISFAMR